MRTLREAYAKVNLALDVGAALASGLHPIASWMAPVDLRDTLEFARLPDGSATTLDIRWARDAPRQSPIDWPPEKDLAMRALRALEHAAGRSLPVALRVTKRIPVGGGLGGGSSDAAATLLGLRDLFDLPIDDAGLAVIGMTLGSDVAFFCDGSPPRPAIVQGLGERVTRVPRVDGRLVLVVPSFGCPTGGVYRAFDALAPASVEPDAARVRTIADRARGHGLAHAPLFNALTLAAVRVEPRLGQLLDALAGIGMPHVTGSGSCVFLIDNGFAGGAPRGGDGGGALIHAARDAALGADPHSVVLSVNLI